MGLDGVSTCACCMIAREGDIRIRESGGPYGCLYMSWAFWKVRRVRSQAEGASNVWRGSPTVRAGGRRRLRTQLDSGVRLG